jgi:hypothetical protein
MNSSAINEVLDAQIAAFDARQGERMIEALCAFLHRFVAYPSVQAAAKRGLSKSLSCLFQIR